MNYDNRIVAFVDILGFESIIKSLPSNQQLFESLDYALKRIKWIETSSSEDGGSTSNLEVSVFSDSIAITTTEDHLLSLISSVGWLQAHLMYVGINVRGGIAIGPTMHKDGILYGEGMISAYMLESKSAIYPRIILSKQIVDKSDVSIAGLIKLDLDGFYYVDSFMFEAVGSNADELAADGHSPRKAYLQVIGSKIHHNISTCIDENHLAKHMWLGKKFNSTVIEFNKINADKLAPIYLGQ